ncbi:MAG: polyprenol phosphomannose-dependent alpha 1,6 mannosyltransferase MptB [Corynebacterium sp.]|nr:polyprenol phosphomannose-dependent alpha 1,6 mannosyltransferase MptB [Corynebacterium sp.]
MFSLKKWYRPLRADFPRVGTAGSRSALLHVEEEYLPHAPCSESTSAQARRNIPFFIWLGLVGSLTLSICGIGAGALPVLNNPYSSFPFGLGYGAYLARNPDVASVGVMMGAALMLLAWVGLAPYVGLKIPGLQERFSHALSAKQILLVAALWSLPFAITAPLFSQDIYSYLAQGSITAQHMDPYSGGPVDLLGADNNLARSVPNTWAHSPAPYGPVATGLAALISIITNDALVPAVLLHRILSYASMGLMAACIPTLARRFNMDLRQAYWFVILNPLTSLHLVAGIHNDSIMIALVLLGFLLCYKGLDAYKDGAKLQGLAWVALACITVSIGGLVKVPAFLALGFFATGLARAFFHHRPSAGSFLSAPYSMAQSIFSIALAGIFCLVWTLLAISAVSLGTGLGFGWIFVQGGASDVVSWRSIITQLGQLAHVILTQIGAGNHAASTIFIARLFGYGIIVICIIRFLWASFTGALGIFPGYAVAMTATVILFPVIHPWYLLWAFIPLVLWANRQFTRNVVIAITIFMTMSALPRSGNFGVLPTMGTYIFSVIGAIAFAIVADHIYRRFNPRKA